MQALFIAVGNRWRGDDGAAHRVLELMEAQSSVTCCGVQQLTPELSTDVARAECVLFLDADASVAEPCIERVVCNRVRGTPLAHSMTPEEVVYLAERLYGFSGSAFLCRLPAVRFDGEELSDEAEAGARAAAAMVCDLVERFSTDCVEVQR